MKVIELLNKIANGEEVPEKIKYINSIWKYDKETKDYFHDDLWLIYTMNSIGLTEREVEMIEEDKKEDNKIEKLDTWFGIKPVNGDSPTTFKENAKYIDHNTEMFFEKINEIIDKVNKLGE